MNITYSQKNNKMCFWTNLKLNEADSMMLNTRKIGELALDINMAWRDILTIEYSKAHFIIR